MWLLPITFVVGVGICSASIFTEDEIKNIREFAETALRCHDIPGATIAVVKGNDSWTLPLGYADIAANRKVTAETNFGLASITKSFTSTLVAILIEESNGTYTFDTPVSEILGDEYHLPDDERTRRTTIKDLLSHRTGLASLVLNFLLGAPPGVDREQLARLAHSMPIAKQFRDEFYYTNYGYMLAGHLAEKVWGGSWEDNLKSKLLDKLEMSSTEPMTDADELIGERYARPYVIIRGELTESHPFPFLSGLLSPAGYIASSASDMVKFLKFFLNKGKLSDGTQLLQESSIAKLWEPVIPVSPMMRSFMQRTSPSWPVGDISLGYALGWGVNAYRGQQYVYHPGVLHSYSSMMEIFPDLDLGLFISVNGPSPTVKNMPLSSIQAILYYITDIVTEKEPWINLEQACTFPKPWLDMSALLPPTTERKDVKPEFPLVKYTGTYFNPLIGALVISVDSAADELKVEVNDFQGALSPEEDGLFGLEAKGHYAFLTWPEKDNPVFMFKVKFLPGETGFDGLEILNVPPFEPPLAFQIQREEGKDLTREEL